MQFGSVQNKQLSPAFARLPRKLSTPTPVVPDRVQLTPPENEELKRWKDRLRPELGQLQTLPIAEPGSVMDPARHYVEGLLLKLAGEDFKAQNMTVRVEIFSGDVPQAGLDDSTELEQDWADEHPGQAWPIRTWYEAPPNGKALYRVALSAGLLRTLQSEDELAFVLAQQASRLLQHDKQDPQNEEELSVHGQSFVEPGEMQSGADHDGLERMRRAGFNPGGALDALNRLWANRPAHYSSDDQTRALQAAAAGHEHEGLRIALMQTQVEDLRRSGDPTTAKPLTPLPAGLVPPGPALYEKAVEDYPKFQKAFTDLADLVSDHTPDWMFDNGSRPPQVWEIRRTEACREDYERVLLETCTHLEQSGKPVQQQVDGLLRLLLATRAKPLPEEKPFREETIARLQAFCSRPGWNPDAFLATLKRAPEGDRRVSLLDSLVDDLGFNETFQRLGIERLAQLAPQHSITDPKTGEQDLGKLPSFYAKNQNEPHNTWSQAPLYNEAVRSFVRGLDAETVARQRDEDGLPLALSLTTRLLDTRHQSAADLDALENSLESMLQAAHNVRESDASRRLRPPLQDPARVSAYSHGLFASEAWGAWSPEFEAGLPSLLLDLARSCSGQSGLVDDTSTPRTLHAGEERRICELLKQTTNPADREALLRYLCRHWDQQQRVPGTSARRNWTQPVAAELAKRSPAELTRELSQPDRSQHAETLRNLFVTGYRLQDSDLPDASTASLAALEERHQAGEFEPKPEDYPNEEDYYQALNDYSKRVDRMSEAVEYLAPAESRLVLSKLAILGHDEKISAEVARRLSRDQFSTILAGAEEAKDRAELICDLAENNAATRVGADAGGFLVDGYLAVEAQFADLESSYNHLDRLLQVSSSALEARAGTRRKVADALFPRLDRLEPEQAHEWLGKDHILGTLSAPQAGSLLVKVLGDAVRPEADVTALAKQVAALNEEFKLQEEHPAVYAELRNTVTEKANLQPGTVDTVFPPDARSGIESTSVFTREMRGLSGLIAISRGRSPEEQIQTIEYLMGREKTMPVYLEQASEDQNFAPITQSLQNLRATLAESDPMVRVVVANSFLAGPSGIMRNPQGREAVINHFMRGIPEKHSALARKVANAIMEGQGEADTLAVAYMLGQPPKKVQDGDPAHMDEANMMSRLFDSYGVPGIKMKQYLAFTSEFGAYKEAFESAQDAAMPLNYFQVLKLIQKRFGDDWPRDFTVERVLGSGSVNIAIKYRNEKTGQSEVVSLGREDIVEATRYDFARFEKFLHALTKTPEDQEQFGYVLGLLGIIHDSVDLEFEKEAVLQVQKAAYKAYHKVDDGWTVRSIDAYQVKNLGLFMEEAKGKTARKIFQQNPRLYRQAMRPMARAEMGILRGQDSRGNLWPKAMFANPDFHDGQVLIDEANKTVTILDFGQAVPISNAERKCGLDLLTVIGKGDSARAAVKRLNRRFFPNGGGLTEADLKPILARKERMDIFIHLLSEISQKGADVPISAVHWILGLNRQIALGTKLGQPLQKQVRNMVITHKLGLPLGVYNTAHAVKQKMVNWAMGLGHTLGLWGVSDDSASVAPDGEKPTPEDESWHWKPENSFLPK